MHACAPLSYKHVNGRRAVGLGLVVLGWVAVTLMEGQACFNCSSFHTCLVSRSLPHEQLFTCVCTTRNAQKHLQRPSGHKYSECMPILPSPTTLSREPLTTHTLHFHPPRPARAQVAGPAAAQAPACYGPRPCRHISSHGGRAAAAGPRAKPRQWRRRWRRGRPPASRARRDAEAACRGWGQQLACSGRWGQEHGGGRA